MSELDSLPQLRLDLLLAVLERNPEINLSEAAREAELLTRFVYFGDTGAPVPPAGEASAPQE